MCHAVFGSHAEEVQLVRGVHYSTPLTTLLPSSANAKLSQSVCSDKSCTLTLCVIWATNAKCVRVARWVMEPFNTSARVRRVGEARCSGNLLRIAPFASLKHCQSSLHSLVWRFQFSEI